MRNRFIRLAWMIVLGMGVCMVVPVQATFTVLDVFRGTQLTLQSIERASQYAANLSKNNALEKQIQIWTAKTEITPPKASTYEYALKNDSDISGNNNKKKGKTAEDLADYQLVRALDLVKALALYSKSDE